MASVTQMVKAVSKEQPYGGFLKTKQFEEINLEKSEELYPQDLEKFSPMMVGLVTDYMSRFMSSKNFEDAFDITLIGAYLNDRTYNDGSYKYCHEMLSQIKGLDDKSIEIALNMVAFDGSYRAGIQIEMPFKYLEANEYETHNIRVMVERYFNFVERFGPVIKDGFEFSPNGYTNLIHSGDGDFLTHDTLFDMKVSKSKATGNKNYKLQILMYYLMGKRSGNAIFDGIEYMGFYNPRLHQVHRLKASDIDEDIINHVEKNIIGY